MTQPNSRMIAARALLSTIAPEERRLREILESVESSATEKSRAAKELDVLSRREVLLLADMEDEGSRMRVKPEPEYLIYHLLYKIVCSLVEHPDAVSVQTISTVSEITFSVTVDPDDMGRFRGEHDRNLEALQKRSKPNNVS